jgi:RNA polymerase sigma factor (sigma-70 family)
MQRFAAGRDQAAFEALVLRHGPMVLHVCRRILRDEHAAEDAFQATFLVLARKAATLGRQESVGNWLYGVAARVSLRARVEAARRQDRERRTVARSGRDPLAELTVREAQQILDEELSGLPARYRAPLVLCCLEGMARDEAAQQLGCRLATLKSRLERARALLHRRLARRGLVLPASLLAEDPAAAAVPAPLVRLAVQAAAGTLVSPTVVALAEGAACGLSASKLQVAAWALLAVLACGGGAGLVLSWSWKAQQPAVPTAPEIAQRGDAAAKAAPVDDSRQPTKQPERPSNATPAPDKGARVPNTPTGWKGHATLTGHQGAVRALRFTPDGSRLVSGGEDGRVRVWDVATARPIGTLHGSRARPIRAVALGADNTVAVGNDDGTVLVYDTGVEQEPRPAFSGRGLAVSALTFGDDGRSLAWARSDGAVERSGGRNNVSLPPAGPQEQVQCVAFSPEGRRLAWGMKDGRVRLWDAVAGKELGRYAVHQHPVWCVVFDADGRTAASVDHFGSVALWDAATGRQVGLLQNPCRGGHVHVQALAFSPDGSLMATGGVLDHTIRVWQTRPGRQIAHLVDHQGPIFGLAFSPDGKLLASASGDGTIRLWTATYTPEADPKAAHGPPARLPDK